MGDIAIWTEKYRPKTFSEVKGQKDIVEKLKAFVNQKNIPHLLFAGPAGVGKSTLALVTARELYGEDWHQNFLELNASDERGIDVVRNKVKDFARTRTIGNAPFKIIFLDECDALTKEAQQALRRTMEKYTQTTRFILSCNFSSKILDPIQSRCAIFRFKPLDRDEIKELIDKISKEESLDIEKPAWDALYNISFGDCRRLENIMQSCAAISKKITENLVYSMSSVAKPEEINAILTKAINNQFLDARRELFDLMLKYGLSGQDMIVQIQKEILNLKLEPKKQMQLIADCGETEFRMTEGSDEFVQLEALLAKFAL